VANRVETAVGQEQEEGRQARLLRRVWLPGLFGAVISLTMYLLLSQQEQRRDETEFRRQIATYMGAFQEHRNGSEDLLRTLRALYFQSPKLSRQFFSNVVDDLSIRMSGMHAIGWAPRVMAKDRPVVEQEARNEGVTGFQIVEGDLTIPGAQGLIRATDRAQYYPLLFIEPTSGNETALGYDLAFQPSINQLLTVARKEGGAAVSGPLTLQYYKSLKTAVMAAMPVYFPEFVPVTQAERERQNQGYVIAVFIIDELMKSVSSRVPNLRLDTMFLDDTPPSQGLALGTMVNGKTSSQTSLADAARFRERPHFTTVVSLGGRKVEFTFRRSDNWDRGLGKWVPPGALLVGLLLTGFVAQAVYAAGEKANEIKKTVRVRTAELAEANAKLKAEVGERIVAQNQLAQEHNLLNLLLNRLPDPVHVIDREGNYVLANDAHVRLIQAQEPAPLLGRPVRQIGPPALAETLAAGSEELFVSGKAVIGQESIVHLAPDQSMNLEISKLPMRDAKGGIDGFLVISRDVTQIRRNEAEQRELERRLQETQKLESLGIIAGGIAHDFNNLLTIILGNANIARLELPSDSNMRECLSRIEATSLRAADLCKQMLAYSGKGLFLIRRLSVNKLVEELKELLLLSISKRANLNVQLASAVPSVLADSTQLQQILMNLVTNASEAIGDRDGTISVRSGLVQVDAKILRTFSPATDIPPGEYVFLEVTDDGCGMTSEIRAKIFDPFFSTKFTGRGLGLAAVLGIVRSHRGAITVQSDPGKGSAFKLFLPPVEGAPEGQGETSPIEPSSSWRGAGTILVAEDEPAVRVTTADLLRASGFSVELTENGRIAIDKFRMTPDRYRAVLLDFAMPEADGEEAFLEIRQIRPQAIVFIMSGYGPQQVLARFKGKGLNGFIQKPFQSKDLIATLRNVLEPQE
jgi:PAS domain S-box-containing protein